MKFRMYMQIYSDKGMGCLWNRLFQQFLSHNNYGTLAMGNGIYTAQDMIKRLRREQQITY